MLDDKGGLHHRTACTAPRPLEGRRTKAAEAPQKMTTTLSHRTRHCRVLARRWLFGTILCILISRAEASECEDTDYGNADAYGDDCSDYTRNANTCSGTSCWCYKSYTWDTSRFSAATMCCACGGGRSSDPSPSPSPPPPPSPMPPPPACVDTDHGATDTYRTGCSVYYTHPSYCGTRYDDQDFTANSMCCACGGGTFAGASPSPPPPSPSPPPPPLPPSPSPPPPPPNPPPMSENLLTDPYNRETWDVQADGGSGCLFASNYIITSYAVSRTS